MAHVAVALAVVASMLLMLQGGTVRQAAARQSQPLGIWTLVPCPTTHALLDISMVSPTDGWIVGAGGTILHWDGTAWSIAASPVTVALNAVDMLSATDGWAVGDAGTIVHWDGAAWTQVPNANSDTYLQSVDMLSAVDGWAVGEWSDLVLHWDGNTWSSVSAPGLDGPISISMVSPTDGWIANNMGSLLHWNGSVWSPDPTTFPSALLAVKMRSPTDGWVVGGFYGGGSVAYRWDGNAWVQTSAPVRSWWSVDSVSPGDAWMVGSFGAIAHWDGAVWTTVSSPVNINYYLMGVDMLSATDGWAVSDGAEILHYTSESTNVAVTSLNAGTPAQDPGAVVPVLLLAGLLALMTARARGACR